MRNDKNIAYYISSFIFSSFIFSSFIFSSPLYASPHDDLEQTKAAIEQSKERQAKLTEEKKRLEEELSDLQERLVKSASSTQKAETDTASAEEKLRILSEQLQLKNKALDARRKNLASLTQAALHLSQLPPETMVLEPGNDDQVKAARALKMMSDSIRSEIDSIRSQTEELKRLQEKVASRQTDVSEKQGSLTQERRALRDKLAAKKALQAKLGKSQKEEEERLAELARKAEDLQTLINTVARKAAAPGGKRSFAGAKGQIRLPVEGTLIQRFSASPGGNGTSRGIILSTAAARAEVVAPFDGEVVFVGPFLNYGNMVIIRHSDDFHTLLAGLGTIHAGVGDFLLEGEPIGAMGDNAPGRRLYVELRKHNQPIDPGPWIKGLNKK